MGRELGVGALAPDALALRAGLRLEALEVFELAVVLRALLPVVVALF